MLKLGISTQKGRLIMYDDNQQQPIQPTTNKSQNKNL